MKIKLASVVAVLGALAFLGSGYHSAADSGSWSQKTAPLMTRWAKEVSPENAHQEYPRPQLVRPNWVNLNGLWDYSVISRDQSQPQSIDGKILVPFPIESALSGVMRTVTDQEQIWYQKTFTIPQDWKDQKIILHFGASDWETTVFVNDQKVGSHKGGYSAFSMDITSALLDEGAQKLTVTVWDPTDAGTQPRGKQINNPHGIWYTPTSGIWQTVWLEPVTPNYIQKLNLTPNIDEKSITITIPTVAEPKAKLEWTVTVLDAGKYVSQGQIGTDLGPESKSAAPRIVLGVKEPKLWSPDSPFLYDVKVTLKSDGEVVDEVTSYFGMRKIHVGKDQAGINRLMLNNEPLFQFGPLDQGFWPDGLYTAPSDEALKYDLEITKKLGFNMARKHVKVEPDRWYYHCDKMGILVWQDMPSGDKYIGTKDPDIIRTKASADQYEYELKEVIDQFCNHPSIVMWVPFNEGWGQFDTPRITQLVKKWDPTRLVNNTSGWADRNVGDVMDIHVYPGPGAPALETDRAGVLGEYGGLGYPIQGHLWKKDGNWGYVSYANADELAESYIALIDKMHPLSGRNGLSAAVYTQTTDVEIEVNGLMTYDREIIKMNPETIAAANKRMYTAPTTRQLKGDELIPPATPLVAHDPYLSIWSQADKLTDTATTHWTGREHPMSSIIRVDGKPYRLMGATPRIVPALEQRSLDVYPTRTVYGFEGAGIEVTLTFMTPALPQNLMVLTRPITSLSWDIRSLDGAEHEVEIYFDAAADLVINNTDQKVVWERVDASGMSILRMGHEEQNPLNKKGDDLRIDWGHLYVGTDSSFNPSSTVAEGKVARSQFAREGELPEMDTQMPRAAKDRQPVIAFAIQCGKITSKEVAIAIGYDDDYSIQFMGKNLLPYWKKDGATFIQALAGARDEYFALKEECKKFDEELMKDLTDEGGVKYAKLCALAYRHSLAGCKVVVDDNGQPLMFSKENHSNGCIGTVDIFYPQSPILLFLSPSLMKATVVPVLEYSSSTRWKFRFAPHDLGTYPQANGQVYGGGEKTEENQMPVEETANMMILMAAIAESDGNVDFALPYWNLIVRWADYLREKGFDPENQLCTDDFAGHLAHNINLSAKAIVALGAFSKLSDMKGEKIAAELYRKTAQELAERWVREARDGDHFKLAFDKKGTWSQKYNLVWDKILNLGLFPDSVAETEMAYYKKVQKPYGLPLDNRSEYTKLDWILWTACLTGNRADFDALLDPVFKYLNTTPDRAPMSDWYWAHDAKKRGFTARPVVGGVFLKMLYNKPVWEKWSKRDQLNPKNWASMPKKPEYIRTVIVPSAETELQEWRYTTTKPADNWFEEKFDTSSWKAGKAGFGTTGTPAAIIGTEWKSSDIWLCREFELQTIPQNLSLRLAHDEDAEIYVNSTLIATFKSYTTYIDSPLTPSQLNAFKIGKNRIAVHCNQTTGGQYIDVGFQTLELIVED
ncbi:MAG: DUF4965 domain-containing protein [Verrucomicrobia bacterium]|nr:DUF4965 domain-containing protein [Verrucomicrobiota bacterium]